MEKYDKSGPLIFNHLIGEFDFNGILTNEAIEIKTLPFPVFLLSLLSWMCPYAEDLYQVENG
jgi:hypothetical protein